jgi:hypothetical protein
MEFSQDKLSKKEWDAAEVPVSESEQTILSMLTIFIVQVTTANNLLK